MINKSTFDADIARINKTAFQPTTEQQTEYREALNVLSAHSAQVLEALKVVEAWDSAEYVARSDAIEAHLREQGYKIVTHSPNDRYTNIIDTDTRQVLREGYDRETTDWNTNWFHEDAVSELTSIDDCGPRPGDSLVSYIEHR